MPPPAPTQSPSNKVQMCNESARAFESTGSTPLVDAEAVPACVDAVPAGSSSCQRNAPDCGGPRL
eukprot:616826-Pyramimonas_sp.AAC.1